MLRFELALHLNKIDVAYEIATKEENDVKYKQVKIKNYQFKLILKKIGDLALINGFIDIGIKCFEASKDYSGLLLIYSSLGMKKELKSLAFRAKAETKFNIAFTSFFMIVNY